MSAPHDDPGDEMSPPRKAVGDEMPHGKAVGDQTSPWPPRDTVADEASPDTDTLASAFPEYQVVETGGWPVPTPEEARFIPGAATLQAALQVFVAENPEVNLIVQKAAIEAYQVLDQRLKADNMPPMVVDAAVIHLFATHMLNRFIYTGPGPTGRPSEVTQAFAYVAHKMAAMALGKFLDGNPQAAALFAKAMEDGETFMAALNERDKPHHGPAVPVTGIQLPPQGGLA